MLRHEPRLDLLCQGLEPRKVAKIEPFGTAKRQADAVQAHGILAADGVEPAQRRSTAHVVLGVHLAPAEGGTGREDISAMCGPRRPIPATAGMSVTLCSPRSMDPPLGWRDGYALGVTLPPLIFWQVPTGT